MPTSAHRVHEPTTIMPLDDVRVLDLSLETVLAYGPDDGQVVSRTGWASPDALLVSVAGLRDDQWSLLEVPLDGGDPTTGLDPFEDVGPVEVGVADADHHRLGGAGGQQHQGGGDHHDAEEEQHHHLRPPP